MSTPEGKVKAQIKKLLNQYAAYSHMPVQNGMGSPSLDFVCCINGIYLAIEAKTRGKKPTPRQKKTMAQMSRAGGIAIWVDEDRIDQLEELLKKLSTLKVTFNENPDKPRAQNNSDALHPATDSGDTARGAEGTQRDEPTADTASAGGDTSTTQSGV